MDISIFSGKGGVGKTLTSSSLATFLSSIGKKTALVDYDGGHSVKNTLGIDKDIPPNEIKYMCTTLAIAIVENNKFVSVAESQSEGWHRNKYFNQFKGDQGIVPLADMASEFFGVPSDIPTIQKFMELVRLLIQLQNEDFENVIIDVEPTAGLERLLSNSNSMARSLTNLQSKGIMFLTAVATTWPDISGYLRTGYIKEAHVYANRIKSVVSMMKNAKHFIVCIPELSPVRQTFEVAKIIEKFGGVVVGYVVNNVRNESFERENIKLLPENKPLVKIDRQPEFHDANLAEMRISLLQGIGKKIFEKLLMPERVTS